MESLTKQKKRPPPKEVMDDRRPTVDELIPALQEVLKFPDLRVIKMIFYFGYDKDEVTLEFDSVYRATRVKNGVRVHGIVNGKKVVRTIKHPLYFNVRLLTGEGTIK